MKLFVRGYSHINISSAPFSGSVKDGDTTILTLSEEEFEEYKRRGYFRSIRYTWTEQNGVYTVYILQTSYNMLIQNMETTGLQF